MEPPVDYTRILNKLNSMQHRDKQIDVEPLATYIHQLSTRPVDEFKSSLHDLLPQKDIDYLSGFIYPETRPHFITWDTSNIRPVDYEIGVSKRFGDDAMDEQRMDIEQRLGSKPHASGSRPGDWICNNCEGDNFRFRERCFRCGMDKNGEGSSFRAAKRDQNRAKPYTRDSNKRDRVVVQTSTDSGSKEREIFVPAPAINPKFAKAAIATECKYGLFCNRADCKFSHPSPATATFRILNLT